MEAARDPRDKRFEETEVAYCGACREQVPPKATRCPYCRTPLRGVPPSERPTSVLTAWRLLFLVAGCLIGVHLPVQPPLV